MSQPVAEVGGYKNITETGAVSTGPCQVIGFYVNSTNGGTLVLRDGGSGGTVMCGTITPAIGFTDSLPMLDQVFMQLLPVLH
jgi:hypothetical protein